MKGVVVKFDSDKGYGFIRSEGHEQDFFVHIKSVTNADTLSQGQAVEFDGKETAKGLSAVLVVAGKKQASPYLFFGALSAIIVVGITLLLSSMLPILVAYLIAINATIFMMYGYDKSIAGSDKLRVPEWVLHSLAFLGGSPGALLAQRVFRHKSIKGSFQLAYWGIVALQVLIVVLFLS